MIKFLVRAAVTFGILIAILPVLMFVELFFPSSPAKNILDIVRSVERSGQSVASDLGRLRLDFARFGSFGPSGFENACKYRYESSRYSPYICECFLRRGDAALQIKTVHLVRTTFDRSEAKRAKLTGGSSAEVEAAAMIEFCESRTRMGNF